MPVCNHSFIVLVLFFIQSFNICISQSFTTSNRYFDSLNEVYKIKQLDDLFIYLKKEKHFNGAFLIAKDETILYENVSGYSSYLTKQRLNLHSSFEIASISKSFTAVAVLMLYEEGKVDIHQNVSYYLPDFPYTDITVHQLLCHRSGLPDYFNFAEKYHKDILYPLTNDSLLSMLQTYKPNCSTIPDNNFEYSNTGYAVLANLIEKVSGMSLKQYFNTRIFEPYGMRETFLYQFGDSVNIMLGHKSNKKVYSRNFISGVIGDKGIQSSIHDLYLWAKLIFSEKIIKKESLILLSTPHNPEKPFYNNYGYGFRIGCDGQKNIIFYHGGLWNGNHSLLVYRPYDQAVIVILSNIYNKSFIGRSGDIFRILDEL
jgi:CubicO group peptidase (beta-lactamase class C family)